MNTPSNIQNINKAIAEVKRNIKGRNKTTKPPKHNIQLKICSNDIKSQLEKEEEIPSEKTKTNNQITNNLQLIPPITPMKSLKISFNSSKTSPQYIKEKSTDKINLNKANSNYNNDSDESQKTLKCNFKPCVIKNYKNFFRYKSNIDNELNNKNKAKSPLNIIARGMTDKNKNSDHTDNKMKNSNDMCLCY